MKIKNIIFWIGILTLIANLATYYSEITTYFTKLGQIGLIVSIVLIIVSYVIKKK